MIFDNALPSLSTRYYLQIQSPKENVLQYFQELSIHHISQYMELV